MVSGNSPGKMLYHGEAILNFSQLYDDVTKPGLEEQNSMVPIFKAFMSVIRYEEHDQDGGSMKKVCFHT